MSKYFYLPAIQNRLHHLLHRIYKDIKRLDYGCIRQMLGQINPLQILVDRYYYLTF